MDDDVQRQEQPPTSALLPADKPAIIKRSSSSASSSGQQPAPTKQNNHNIEDAHRPSLQLRKKQKDDDKMERKRKRKREAENDTKEETFMDNNDAAITNTSSCSVVNSDPNATLLENIQLLPNPCKITIIQYVLGRSVDEVDSKGLIPLMEAVAKRKWSNIVLIVEVFPLLFVQISSNNNNNNNNTTDDKETKNRIKGNDDVVPDFDINFNKGCWAGSTALHVACMGSRRVVGNHRKQIGPDVEIVDYLIRHGSDVNIKTGSDRTPLHTALYNMLRLKPHDTPRQFVLQTAELLIRNGANVHAKDSRGYTPLHYASMGGPGNLVRLLVESNADVNVQDDKFGNTPLHYAFHKYHTNNHDVKMIVSHLIEGGGNVDTLNKYGCSPLLMVFAMNDDAALRRVRQNMDTIHLLISNGSKTTFTFKEIPRNEYGPLDRAEDDLFLLCNGSEEEEEINDDDDDGGVVVKITGTIWFTSYHGFQLFWLGENNTYEEMRELKHKKGRKWILLPP